MVTLLVLGVFITPEEFGLHAFYRERICGVSRPDNLSAGQGAMDTAARNRAMATTCPDRAEERPLHLVCCAPMI